METSFKTLISSDYEYENSIFLISKLPFTSSVGIKVPYFVVGTSISSLMRSLAA
jgi:hypothetical protein